MNGLTMNFAIHKAKSNFNFTMKDHKQVPVFLITIQFSFLVAMKKTKELLILSNVSIFNQKRWN